jgi:epoxyqueuosine reductase QueG
MTRKAKIAELTGELKEFGLKVGAETIGVAPIERFAPAPVGFRPDDLLPGARSVVGFTVPQLAGYCENTPNNSYTQFGYIFKNLYIDRIAWEVARFLDDHGYWALPYCREGQTTTQVQGFNPNPFFERDYRDPEKAASKVRLTMRGDISMRKAVEAAGLGRIGVNGLLLTPSKPHGRGNYHRRTGAESPHRRRLVRPLQSMCQGMPRPGDLRERTIRIQSRQVHHDRPAVEHDVS